MSVIYRQVVTSLEVKCRKPGGRTIRECVEDASGRLASLEDTVMPLIQARVEEIEVLVQPHSVRPPPEALRRVHRLADECMGYCVAIRRPGLAGSLRSLCQLVDLVDAQDVWKPGSFAPVLHMVNASLKGGLTRSQVQVLVAEMDQVLKHLKANIHPAPGAHHTSIEDEGVVSLRAGRGRRRPLVIQ